MKAKIVRDSAGLFYGIQYRCPCDDEGCGLTTLPVNWRPAGESAESPHQAGHPHWSFNGDFEKPVFGPSVLNTWSEWQGHGKPGKPHVCHSFIGCNGAQPGQIILLGDCTHGLKGQTVDLPEIEP
ncbi:hypothetical protein AB1286_29830 [Trinickia sp. NRRL B-1857]|uniref:hypothetical protein n=1 Tax=Trinickia sp. NRRL B-1857 TaxID=3162879 RepID=UPI003D2A77A7